MSRPAPVLVLSLALLLSCAAPGSHGEVQIVPKPAGAPPQLTGVIQTLLALIDKQDKAKITSDDYESTSIRQLITLGTPAGYRIKLRYLEFGITMVEALKVARDEELRRRLIEMVQWSRRPRVRSEAIITLASLSDPTHKKYLKSAVLDSNVSIRFAAIEALQIWGQDEAVSLLKLAMGRDWSPLMQIWAAQALLSLGDQSGLVTLWRGMDHDSWVVRAMAARYLGDYAKPEDYERLLPYLNRETRNDFVAAELCIAELKLISKKGEKVSYSPADKRWRENEEVKYALGKDDVIELEPLVIVPPQLRIPASLRVAAQINTQLLRLIRDRLSEPLEAIQAQDPVLNDLNALETPTGFALKTRYSQLSYLVVEGLAGTNDLMLRSELKRLATDATNPLVKATALIALSYSRDENDLYLMQDALRHNNAIVRFGAMEAMEIGRFKSAVPSLIFIANQDASPALRIYAMQLLAKFGDLSGRQMLLGQLNNADWPARAMAFWYLGRYGDPSDYSLVLARLPVETNPFVQAEICLATLRLTPVK